MQMKKQLIRMGLPIVIMLISATLYALPVTFAEQPSAQDKAIAFIENALPLDLSKYSMNLTSQSSFKLPTGETQYMIQYSLNSAESTAKIICIVQNNVVMYCQVSSERGPIISRKTYPNLLDAAKNFLGEYQSYTKSDLTKLIAALDNVDLARNSTTTTGNAKLTITNELSGDCLTFLKWANTANGVDYTSLQVAFQKGGTIVSVRDDRAVYAIGDTSIKISSSQAIDIALKNLPTYSYKMPDQTMVSDFNITEAKTTAELTTSLANLTLRPCWNVKLPLNQTYPGSVQGISVFIWANSGEVFSHSNIAFGGADYSEISSLEPSPAPTAVVDTNFAIAIALAAIVLATVSIVIIKKKRK